MKKTFLMSGCVVVLFSGCESKLIEIETTTSSEEKVTAPVMETSVELKPASPAGDSFKKALEKAEA